jgi:MBG domain
MPSHPDVSRPRGHRRRRRLLPSLVRLEERLAPALTFPGIQGITFDASGDLFISYDSSSVSSGQQQSVAEVNANGFLVSSSVFGTTGASAFPGTLTSVSSSASLPGVTSGTDILELQPNGQLFDFNPVSRAASQFDNLASYSASASNVYNAQTGASVNLSSTISLANATFGDFGVYGSSLVVSAESNNWDFVMRVAYGSSGTGVATVLVAAPASDGLSASPEGVAVDSVGTVLTTLPYVKPGSGAVIHVPVGFSLFYDSGSTPAPLILTLGLTTTPDIEAGAITVDSQNNFIIGVKDSPLYGGGAGVAHINAALNAFLADPLPNSQAIPAGIAYQNVAGTDYLAFTDSNPNPFTDPGAGTYTIAGELPLFSGQVSPAQLRHAYGIDQIQFTGPGGTMVIGDGSGQTIAIVEEGVDPTLQADLTTFDQYFGIPAPPSFQIVNQNNSSTQNPYIIGEASLDVEWAHAIAPGASIVVYNSQYEPNNGTASIQNLLLAMQQASKLPGVSVVTLSYGVDEYSLAQSGLSQVTLDSYFTTPRVTFLAASGDTGIYGSGSPRQVVADYPAASPNVVSVGGTSIVIDAAGDYPGTGQTAGEVAWGYGTSSYSQGGGGGGLSSYEGKPAWQTGVVPTSMDPTNARALPDVSMDSGSAQEYDVFTSTLGASSNSAAAVGWLGDAGTSAASPIWAGLIAIANQGRALAGGTPLTGYTQTLPALYSLPSTHFHDILYGSNGDAAGPGYDLATGRGTPIANLVVPALAGYGLPSQMSIKTEPPSSVTANTGFGLTVQVEDSLGNPASGGYVTVALGTNPTDTTLGGTLTAPVQNGLATFLNLTISEPDSGYTLTITDSSFAGALTTSSITVTPPTVTQSPATLTLFNLSFTYNGTPHYATASTNPTGLSGVTISYTQNGVAVSSPTHAGNYTVSATLSNANYVATPVMGTLAIGQATPTLNWADPANITVGTPLTSAQLDATAAFNGTSLPGGLVYTPSLGTLLPVGNAQTLKVVFTPSDTTDFTTATSSASINVLPQSPPPPTQVVIIGEQPVFRRKRNKRGKPVGAAILTGFTLDFNMPLVAAAVSNPANYQLGTVTTRKVKNKVRPVLKPIRNFTVTYTTDSVTLRLRAGPKFPLGGTLTVLPGVTVGSGDVLSGTTVFKITVGGKKIKPA